MNDTQEDEDLLLERKDDLLYLKSELEYIILSFVCLRDFFPFLSLTPHLLLVALFPRKADHLRDEERKEERPDRRLRAELHRHRPPPLCHSLPRKAIPAAAAEQF
jgi:hypothetical protein